MSGAEVTVASGECPKEKLVLTGIMGLIQCVAEWREEGRDMEYACGLRLYSYWKV
jgi:hypothetical protein